MLACIPTNGGAGLDDTVCDHFGSAPCFTLYDTEQDRLMVVDNTNSHHSHGTCHPMSTLAAHDIQAVVCRGMGRRAVETMNASGIRIFRTRARDVRAVIDELKSGVLRELRPREACAGHSGRRTRVGGDVGTGFGPGHGGCGHDSGAGRGQGAGRSSGGGSGRRGR